MGEVSASPPALPLTELRAKEQIQHSGEQDPFLSQAGSSHKPWGD